MNGATLEVVTPSYMPDRELCGDLAASIRRFAPEGTRHTLIVPARDAEAFAPLAGEHAVVERADRFLPRGFVRVPAGNVWVNVRAPWPPVRGWIAQQIIKLAAAARSTADAVLLVDSDVEFVRPFTLDDLTVDGRVPLYRSLDAISPRLPRHMTWDAVARRLLGLPAATGDRRHDYICWPCLWDPALVRAMLRRVEEVGHAPWQTVVGRELHFSEMVLYGVFVEEIAGAAAHTSDMHCPSFSDERALDAAQLAQFLSALSPRDVAVMISARSGTDLAQRRAAIRDAVSRGAGVDGGAR